MSGSPSLAITLICFAATLAMVTGQMVTFDTNFVELDSSKMVHTSDTNYAICSQSLPSSWRQVSVNGDEVTIVTSNNKSEVKKLSALTPAESTSLNGLKATLTQVIRVGPYNVKSNGLSKLTTFDRNGGSSSMGTGGGSASSSSSSSSSSGGMSVSRTGPNAYIVSKSDFPFNWHRVFVNDDAATIVYRTGRVIMLPQEAMAANEKAKLIELKAEVDKSSKAAEEMTRSMTQSLGNPMDFVNRALGGMFGRR